MIDAADRTIASLEMTNRTGRECCGADFGVRLVVVRGGGWSGFLREQRSACERCTGRLRCEWVVILVVWRLLMGLECGRDPSAGGEIEKREWL